jgi:hypothetical protein
LKMKTAGSKAGDEDSLIDLNDRDIPKVDEQTLA